MMKTLSLVLAALLMLLPCAALAEEQPEPTVTICFTTDITKVSDGVTFYAVLDDNVSAQAFAAQLPLVLPMADLNGDEKFGYLDVSLPGYAENHETLQAGDIMLFGNKCVVVFYMDAPTPFSYTRIGRISDPALLQTALGMEDVVVLFTLDETVQ